MYSAEDKELVIDQKDIGFMIVISFHERKHPLTYYFR